MRHACFKRNSKLSQRPSISTPMEEGRSLVECQWVVFRGSMDEVFRVQGEEVQWPEAEERTVALGRQASYSWGFELKRSKQHPQGGSSLFLRVT